MAADFYSILDNFKILLADVPDFFTGACFVLQL